ncbi:uncharacterized protein METZ01_LOCUS192806, partial [marine metagenome]
VREIPLIFPIALIAIVATLLFSGIYALADNTVNRPDSTAYKYEWHENAAIWVCPFH